ncbi:MAG TPA: hypothetical protein VEF89_04615 [Solirubrobacteraceae bacterium]|nr:hypothetical protein [Solirubrobacteraceae bacterium]
MLDEAGAELPAGVLSVSVVVVGDGLGGATRSVDAVLGVWALVGVGFCAGLL